MYSLHYSLEGHFIFCALVEAFTSLAYGDRVTLIKVNVRHRPMLSHKLKWHAKLDVTLNENDSWHMGNMMLH